MYQGGVLGNTVKDGHVAAHTQLVATGQHGQLLPQCLLAHRAHLHLCMCLAAPCTRISLYTLSPIPQMLSNTNTWF